MRALKILRVALALGALPLSAFSQQPSKLTEVVDKIVAQEQAEMQSLHQYSPIVETYIQVLRSNKIQGAVPKGDKYFLGRAELAKGVELEPLITDSHTKHNMFGGMGRFVSMEFLPRGFLQMIYVDTTGFNRQHYKFNYVGREFLGQVRCLVFDVDPVSKDDKGRFVGRIWVEDQDYHIVRFNGGYSSRSKTSYYFNFDSWRMNAGKDKWLPAFIYSEEANNPMVQSFKAQTRLWSYAPTQDREEQELSKVVVEAPNPVTDQTEVGNDYSPLEQKRAWERQAEDNIATKMEQMGLMAQYGDVDKVLETVVNNLEVTNNLDIEPTVRCRVLMTSTMESFTMGHTIVLSRGLVDVLPDEASLAAILAHELGHIVLRHRMGTQYAFFNRLRFEEKETFRHFGFTHTPEEEQAATQEGMELLKKSPYKDHIGSAQLFLQALNDRSKEIPNLVSPHLGNRVVIGMTSAAATPTAEAAASKSRDNLIAALPLGGRIKIEPWDNRLQMLKTKPVGTVAKDEVTPFELTPFFLYLTRQGDPSSGEVPSAVAVKSGTDADLSDAKP
ncbi:MAG TPA: M48 family metalloprotease [Candidatus Limnocylindrales bacterium]|nr:M48 family metalloprotease [Candidatus Limnocylindrales bacterium]